MQPAGSRLIAVGDALQRPGRGSTFPARPSGWCRQLPANAAARRAGWPAAANRQPPTAQPASARRCSSVVCPRALANSQPSAVRADSCHTPGRAAENRGWRISVSVSGCAPAWPSRASVQSCRSRRRKRRRRKRGRRNAESDMRNSGRLTSIMQVLAEEEFALLPC